MELKRCLLTWENSFSLCVEYWIIFQSRILCLGEFDLLKIIPSIYSCIIFEHVSCPKDAKIQYVISSETQQPLLAKIQNDVIVSESQQPFLYTHNCKDQKDFITGWNPGAQACAGCNKNLKINFFVLTSFQKILVIFDMSDERGEIFHQDINDMEN